MGKSFHERMKRMSFIFYFEDQVQACDSEAKKEGKKERQLQVSAHPDHMVDIYIDDYQVRMTEAVAKQFAESMTMALLRANLIND